MSIQRRFEAYFRRGVSRTTYTLASYSGDEIVTLTISPRPNIAKRAIAYSKHGVAVVQGLSSRALASEIAFKLAKGAREAIEEVMLEDPKAAFRQALAVSERGDWYSFTGFATADEKGHGKCGNVIYSGNGLKEGSLELACSFSENPLFSVLEAAMAMERKGNLWPSKSAALVIWKEGKAEVLSVDLSDDPLFDLLTQVRKRLAGARYSRKSAQTALAPLLS